METNFNDCIDNLDSTDQIRDLILLDDSTGENRSPSNW